MPLALLFITVFTVQRDGVHANLYHECAKLFNPHNYMDHLPTLSLPYINNVKIPTPNIPINPSPVITTKVINIVTKYIYKNPVCVKVSNKKAMCKPKTDAKTKNNMDVLVTKEYFVNDRNAKELKRQHKNINNYHDFADDDEEFNNLNLYVQASEEPRPFAKTQSQTPNLSKNDIQEMLIEDRLDQLETVLPSYTRRRVYQTSTITVTKVRSNNRATATLLVKNCIPQGYDLCPPKAKKRTSKVARYTNSSAEGHYFG